MDPSQQQPGPEQQPGDRTPEPAPGQEQVSGQPGGPAASAPPAAAGDPFAKPGPFGRDRAERAQEPSGPAGPPAPHGEWQQPGPAGEPAPSGPPGQPVPSGHPGQPGPFAPFGQPVPGRAGSHPAYHPYQQFPGYPAPPAPPSTNGFSIAALVSGVVCCMPPLGMILGAVALRQIKKKGQRGKGMAISGIALSAASTLLIGLFFATGAASDFWDEVEKAADEAASYQTVGDLKKGDCYNLPGSGNGDGAEVSEIQVVDCAKPHEAEITGGFKITGFDGFPGEKVLEPLAERRCDDVDTAYAMDAWAIPATMSGYYYIPTKESWNSGDRRVSCGYATENGRKTTGSIRRDAGGLDKDQIAYLTAENKVLRAGYQEPEKDYPEAVQGHLAWAKATASAMGEATAGLRGHTWPGAAGAAVVKRAGQFDKARAAWDKAAKAKDEDTFWEHVFEAEAALDVRTEKTIRQALKLSTTEPVPDDERV
ncbi:DUF4190 domain-containing protein [Streptomyces sp. NPDC003691]